jgi:uncharacterized membrane protein YeaQ/YmgE (transglycosylase-associated protein family)
VSHGRYRLDLNRVRRIGRHRRQVPDAGRDPGGFIVTVILGIVGALVGGYIGQALGMYRDNDPVGFVMAVTGAIVLAAIYRFVARRPRAV